MTKNEYYLKMHEACPLQQGDTVSLNSFEDGEKGCNISVNDAIQAFGKIGIIHGKREDYYHVFFENIGCYGLPYFALELVEKEHAGKIPEFEEHFSTMKFNCSTQKNEIYHLCYKIFDIVKKMIKEK